MALSASEWNQVTFLPFTDAAWTTMPSGGLPVEVLQAVKDGSPLLVFCLQAAAPFIFTYENGPASVSVDVAVVDTDTPKTTLVQMLDNGVRWYNCRNTAGAWLWWDNASGAVNKITDPTILGPFIS